MGRPVERFSDCRGPSSGPKKVACLREELQCETSNLVAKTVELGGYQLLVNNTHSPWRKIFQGGGMRTI
jgi:hypothetical protein